MTVSHEHDIESLASFKYHKSVAQAQTFARDLSQTRANVANTKWMEEQVREMVANHPDEEGRKLVKEVRVLQMDDLKENNMGLFIGVGQGATHLPRCVIVHYQGNPDSDKVDVAMVGKGIVFDSGGLNIKALGGIELMYGDKNGACAVIGALHGVLSLKPKKNLVFAAGLAENACGSRSYHPGDILTSMKGLTVAISNTDAEGRLVLADTMTYVQRNFKPERLIDLATLTGACMVALGDDTAGCFTNNKEFCRDLLKSSKATMEPIWHMPIKPEHRQKMKGTNSDLDNLGTGKTGGACKAAAFLENFVEEDTKWCHLDIAGPALKGGAKAPDYSLGNGFGVRLLLNYLTT